MTGETPCDALATGRGGAVRAVVSVAVGVAWALAPWLTLGAMTELSWNRNPVVAISYGAGSVAFAGILAVLSRTGAMRAAPRVVAVVVAAYFGSLAVLFSGVIWMALDSAALYDVPPNYSLWALPMSATAACVGVLLGRVLPRGWVPMRAAVAAGGVVLVCWFAIGVYVLAISPWT